MSEFPTHAPAAETSAAVRHYMTVGQLREALASYPDDTPMVVQSDAEGNAFHPLAGAAWGWWRPDWREPVNTEDEDDEEPWEPDGKVLPVLFGGFLLRVRHHNARVQLAQGHRRVLVGGRGVRVGGEPAYRVAVSRLCGAVRAVPPALRR